MEYENYLLKSQHYTEHEYDSLYHLSTLGHTAHSIKSISTIYHLNTDRAM